MNKTFNLREDDGKPKIYHSVETEYADSDRQVEPAVYHVVGFTRDTFNLVRMSNTGEVLIMGAKIELTAEQQAEVKKFVEAWINLQTGS